MSECKKCGAKLSGSKFCPDCGAKVVQPSSKPKKDESVRQRTQWSPKRVAWTWGISIGLVAIVALGAAIVVPVIQDDQRRELARVAAIEAAQIRIQEKGDATAAIDLANEALANTGSVGGVDEERAAVAAAITELQASVSANDFEKIEPQTVSLGSLTSTLVAKDKAAVKAAADAAAAAAKAAAAAAAAEAKAAATAQWSLSEWNVDCIRTSKTFCKVFFNLANNTGYDLSVGTSGQIVINGRAYALELQLCYTYESNLDCSQAIAPGSTIWVRTLATDLPHFETLTFSRVTIGDRFKSNLSYNWG